MLNSYSEISTQLTNEIVKIVESNGQNCHLGIDLVLIVVY